uniref:junctophilin-1-like isoform X2 n=1 Tax=Myxine glutinosa TaxID=7769 RepID=UPI00358F51F1
MNGGRFDFDDGGVYCGGWEDGKAHGRGICTGPHGQGEFAGCWSHGFEVLGVYTWPSGNTFAGEWSQGRRHGLGAENKSRWCYRGEWSNGLKGRYGARLCLASGARYEGAWAHGLQDGHGVETYGDGGTYKGQWWEGVRHGHGVRESAPYSRASSILPPHHSSLSSLRQPLANGVPPARPDRSPPDVPRPRKAGFVLSLRPCDGSDRRNGGGSGALLFRRSSLLGGLRPRRSSSKGSLVGPESGTGCKGNSGGSSADSEPPSGQIIGEGGTTVEERGSRDVSGVQPIAGAIERYSGEWRGDRRSGCGVCERSDGLAYEGEWLDDASHGYGRMHFPDGRRQEGKFRGGVLIGGGTRRRLLPQWGGGRVREKVSRAVAEAQRAAAVARAKVEVVESRAAYARSKGETAEKVAQAAWAASHASRQLARKLSPSFHQPGVIYQNQKRAAEKPYHYMPHTDSPRLQGSDREKQSPTLDDTACSPSETTTPAVPSLSWQQEEEAQPVGVETDRCKGSRKGVGESKGRPQNGSLVAMGDTREGGAGSEGRRKGIKHGGARASRGDCEGRGRTTGRERSGCSSKASGRPSSGEPGRKRTSSAAPGSTRLERAKEVQVPCLGELLSRKTYRHQKASCSDDESFITTPSTPVHSFAAQEGRAAEKITVPDKTTLNKITALDETASIDLLDSRSLSETMRCRRSARDVRPCSRRKLLRRGCPGGCGKEMSDGLEVSSYCEEGKSTKASSVLLLLLLFFSLGAILLILRFLH